MSDDASIHSYGFFSNFIILTFTQKLKDIYNILWSGICKGGEVHFLALLTCCLCEKKEFFPEFLFLNLLDGCSVIDKCEEYFNLECNTGHF